MRCECGRRARFIQPGTGRLKADGEHTLCARCYHRLRVKKENTENRVEFKAPAPGVQFSKEELAAPVDPALIRTFVETYLPLRRHRAVVTRGVLQRELFKRTKDVSLESQRFTDFSLRMFNLLLDYAEKYDGHVESITEALLQWIRRLRPEELPSVDTARKLYVGR